MSSQISVSREAALQYASTVVGHGVPVRMARRVATARWLLSGWGESVVRAGAALVAL